MNWIVWFIRRLNGTEEIREMRVVCNKCAQLYVLRSPADFPWNHECDQTLIQVERVA